MERKIIIIQAVIVVFLALLLYINFTVIAKIEELRIVYTILTFLSIFMLALPILIYYYMKYTKIKHIEEAFPIFLRDFVEAVRGGLTIPLAFKSLSKNDYKELTPYIKKISARLDWGMPLDDVLMSFSREVGSKTISRIVASVVEAHKHGGNIVDTFQSLSNVAIEIDRLRKERLGYLQAQIVTGYIIFFVFLAVIIGIERFLMPAISQASSVTLITVGQEAQEVTQSDLGIFFKNLFRNLIIIQGIFSGLAIGKVSEGSLIAGLKHSFFLSFIGGLIYLIAAA
jgi:flagellar protein FlaJ